MKPTAPSHQTAPRPSWTQTPEIDSPPATLLDWLVIRFPRISRTIWKERMEAGRVTNAIGKPLPPTTPFAPRLRVAYFRQVVEEPTAPEPRVLYQDDRIVVADKAPWVPVTPSGPYVNHCLLYQLVRRLDLPNLVPVHRLDRATSGLVLFAHDPETVRPYAECFARGTVERIYEAVASVPSRQRMTRTLVENRIVAGSPFFRMEIAEGPPNSSTQIDLIEWGGGLGRFELRPNTGKKHQLRLHMASLDWPIVGDRYYPELQPKAPDDPDRPLALVAKHLRLPDPHGDGEIQFTSRYDARSLGSTPLLDFDPSRESEG